MFYNNSQLIHFHSVTSLSTKSTCLLVACVLLFPVLVIFRRYRRAVEMVSNLPGLRLIVSPMSILGLVLPRLPMPLYTYPGFAFPSVLKHEGLFKHFKCDTVSLCGALDGRAIIYTCDIPFLTRMASHAGSTVFPKPTEEYGILSYFGDNIVIAERANWRRQRKVTAPAFCSKVFDRLWTDMADITREMVHEEKWDQRTDGFLPSSGARFTPQGEYIPAEGEIYFPNVVDVTLRMALAAIARTGFGIDFEWRTGESFTNTCKGFGDSFYLSALQTFCGVVHAVLSFILPCPLRDYLLHILTDSSPHDSANPPTTEYHSSRIPTKLREMALLTLRGLNKIPQKDMRLQEALHLVAKESTLKLVMTSLPSWASKLPFRRLRRMNMAFDCLQTELRGMVARRRRELTAHYEAKSQVAYVESDESGSSHYSQMSVEDSFKGSFDLLSNLVRSALQSEKAGGATLTEEEIVGNAYIYLLAGHETTAHSLAWTLALLAAYPDEQEKAYREIMEGDPSEETVIRDYPKFRFLLACYYETLRLFPPVQQIPKVAAEDTQIVIDRTNELADNKVGGPSDFVVKLPSATTAPELRLSRSSFAGHRKRSSLPAIKITPMPHHLDPTFGIPSLPTTPTCPPKEYLGSINENSLSTAASYSRSEFIGPMPFAQVTKDGRPVEAPAPFTGSEQTRVVVKKGTIIFISPPAVHYNPKYWKDPQQFKPERFLEPYCRAAFIPFGLGSRACLGRKFSEVESVCMLVHILRNYSVHLPIQPGETVEDVRAKFSKSSVRITLTPDKVPLIFRKRNH